MLYNIDYNISSIIFILICYIFILRRYENTSNTSRCFRVMSLTVILAAILDTVTAVTISYHEAVPVWFNYCLNVVYFLTQGLCSAMMPAYFRYNIYEDGHRTGSDYANIVFICLYFILVITTPFTHWVIFFDANGVYTPGPLYPVMLLIPVTEEIYALVLLLLHRKEFNRKQNLCLFGFVAVTLTGFVIQICLQMFYGQHILLAFFSVALGLVIMLCAYETPDYKRLVATTEELKLSQAQLERARAQAEEATKVVHELMKSASYDLMLDDQGNVIGVNSSPEFRTLLDSGYPPEKPDFEIWFEGIHPEDKGRVFAALERAAKGQDSYSEEFRFYDSSRSYRWYRGSGELMKDDEGNSVFRGVIQNIQDEKLKESLTNEKLMALEKLERSQAALKFALEEAQSASKAKSDFLSNMSHDIRTPMNAVIGFSELALEHCNEPEVVRDYLERIRSSGDHLLMLINDILDMSKIESGRIHLEPEKCDLTEIIRNIEKIVDADIRNHGLHFSLETENMEEGSRVMCDRLRLNQILLNCVGNSIKFTPEGGFVELKVQREADIDDKHAEFTFIIADTGIGMSKEFVKHIFEPFEREHTSTISRTQGSGLGMTITKNLVEMMDGTINVESRENEGTTYIITIPFEVIDSRDMVEDDSKSAPEEVTIEEMEKFLEGRHLLLVDDNATNRLLARGVLKAKGMTADEATNGEEAVKMVENAAFGEYDLILMDVQMPVMNGYEATDRIRALEDPELAELPILAMTANAFDEDKEECLRHGMNDHIAKPYKADQLIRKLYACLKG